MSRVLIVEDIEETRENLMALLCDRYKEWIIDGAGAVDEADTKVDDSVSNGTPYDLVIVDYMLPKKLGYAPEPALDFTKRTFEKLPSALFIQVTAYMSDEDLRAELIHPMLANPDPRLVFVEKNDRWAKKVCEIALQRTLGDPIEDRLDDLFGSESSIHTAHRPRTARSPESVSMTHSLASLRGLITRSWDFLSPDLQRRIRSKFKVDDKIRPIKITMF